MLIENLVSGKITNVNTQVANTLIGRGTHIKIDIVRPEPIEEQINLIEEEPIEEIAPKKTRIKKAK